jgi:hypothetical protein
VKKYVPQDNIYTSQDTPSFPLLTTMTITTFSTSFRISVTKIPDRNNLREEGVHISESSVYGYLVPCAWAEHPGGRSIGTEVIFYLMADWKQRGEDWELSITFKGMLPVTCYLQLGLTSQSFPNVPK